MKVIETANDYKVEKRQLICVVLGMHRCGTSSLTRGLQALGVSLGDSLMPAMIGDNEKGFWEDLDINAINIKLLGELNSSWHDITEIKHIDYSSARFMELRVEAASLIKRKVCDVPLFGFKDPRTSRLLPFWQLIFNDLCILPVYIIASRNPLSVAISLKNRNQFPIQKGLILWVDHQVHAMYHTQSCPRVIVDYDQLIEHPCVQLERIANALNITFDPYCAATIEYAEKFLDKSLRRVHCPNRQLESAPDELSAVALKLYYLLLRESNATVAEEDNQMGSDMLHARSFLAKNQAMFEYIKCQEDALAEVSIKLGLAECKLQESIGQVAAHDLKNQASCYDTCIIDNRLTLVEASLMALNTKVDCYEAENAALMSVAARAGEDIRGLKSWISLYQQNIAELQQSISQLSSVNAYYQQSFSRWITYPLRHVRSFLFRKGT